MATRLPPPPSTGDGRSLTRLRQALAGARFEAEAVAEAMGAEGPNLTPSPKQVPVLVRSLPSGTPLATLIRLFVAGVPVPGADADSALAPLGLDGAAALNLLRTDGETAVPSLRLVPVGPLLVASDLTPDPSRLPPDVTMGVSATSWALANLTVRRPVTHAADVGTGCGVQALFAARHAQRVTATDTSARALAFARFNAALNGATNIDFMGGDLFEPLAGERFDLVVVNPPFVISPDNHYRYRDGGWPRDHLSRHVVESVAAALRPGGLGHALVSWVEDPDAHWSASPAAWVRDLGCDAWLLHFESAEAEDHALNWNQPLEGDTERHGASVRRWLDYLEAQDIKAVGYGAVVLRRRAAATNWVRAHSVGTPPLGPAGDQVWQLFAARDHLDRLGPPEALLGQRLVLDESHRLEQVLHLRDGGYQVEHAVLYREQALPVQAEVDGYTAELLAHLGSGRTLAEAFDAAAGGYGRDGSHGREDLRRATVELVEGMVELGFLRPA